MKRIEYLSIYFLNVCLILNSALIFPVCSFDRWIRLIFLKSDISLSKTGRKGMLKIILNLQESKY